jgi:hypothetical protein
MDDAPKSLSDQIALIRAAARIFGISSGATVKVARPGGPEVPIRLDELLKRMVGPRVDLSTF